MMNWLRKNMRIVFTITIIGFFAGIFVGFGGYFFSDNKFSNSVANVNGHEVSMRKFNLLYNRAFEDLRKNNTEINDETVKAVRQQTIDELVREEVFYQESQKFGIIVTDKEVAANIQQYQAFQQDGRFNQGVYFQIIAYQLKMTPAEFEESQRRQIAIAKMRNLIAAGVKITEPELQVEYARRNSGNIKGLEKAREKFTQ